MSIIKAATLGLHGDFYWSPFGRMSMTRDYFVSLRAQPVYTVLYTAITARQVGASKRNGLKIHDSRPNPGHVSMLFFSDSLN